jgi:hypothetical protein
VVSSAFIRQNEQWSRVRVTEAAVSFSLIDMLAVSRLRLQMTRATMDGGVHVVWYIPVYGADIRK